jgi:hypothetical protein
VDKNPKQLILEKVEHGKNPELVGAESAIRFLPPSLQPYLSQGKLLYMFASRTTAGNGMGQCGAGVERHLGVLDVNRKIPIKVNSFLIESCIDNIELSKSVSHNEDETSSALYGISVNREGQLELKFSSYDDRFEETPTAVLLDDFRKLRFIHPNEK